MYAIIKVHNSFNFVHKATTLVSGIFFLRTSMKKVKDFDIRKKFIAENLDFFKGDKKYFINEFGVNSTNIVDLAMMDFNTNVFYGFEIKSEADNLNRLESQLQAYAMFFNVVYVVVHSKHLEGVTKIVKGNKLFNKVGIIEVTSDLVFNEVQQGRFYKYDYSKLIENLDTEELFTLCESKGLKSSGRKATLIDRLKLKTDLEELFPYLEDKVLKYFYKVCPKCGSTLYYNKRLAGAKLSICYECNTRFY